MSDESASKATKTWLWTTGQDRSGRATHDRRKRRKMHGANFNRVKINLEFRKRSTIEIERDNGPSVRSLAFAPPQMTSRHAEKATHANTGRRGKCRQPEADH